MKKRKKVTRKHYVHRRQRKQKEKQLIKRHYTKRKIRRMHKKTIIKPSVIPVVIVKPIQRRRRKSKNGSRMYFTQDTENAIIAYNKETDLNIREKIFREHILYPFQKLVENIFNTFKFSYFETGPQDVQKECLTHLVANINKFDPTRCSKSDPKKKAKAYSYFSIIAKHYLILLNNTNYIKFLRNIEISEDRDENTVQLQQNDKYYAQQEMTEFIELIIEFWENNINKIFTKERDLNIANAVVELFRKSHEISLFNKKALYLYIREMARCKTQQITKVINKMKQYHDNLQRSYIDEGDVNIERYSAI